MRRAHGYAVLLGGALAVLAGCSSGPTPTPPPSSAANSSAAASVALPPPDQRGPQVTVEGTVTWMSSHPGCIRLETAAGQSFQLTGDVASDNEHRAARGEQPAVQRVRITGYVPEAGASVCSAGRAFVTEKVTPVDR
ncbi:hypothetical protein JNUCC0626_49950 (plasmid) [Lentzea sp. JNUCC 0626]|uniref:hypothetical protein n=1 Tax=Lentzea sp. JNUCC 0626 TaxID=3367513 RepID=UPI0037488362